MSKRMRRAFVVVIALGAARALAAPSERAWWQTCELSRYESVRLVVTGRVAGEAPLG